MTEIKEVFLWYRNLPVMPKNLTTIQQEEWDKKQNETLGKQPFVGQTLSMSPATINDIGQDTISASAFYALDYHILEDGKRCHYHKNTHVQPYAYVGYSVSYEREKFSNQLHSINSREMVELSGVMRSVSWSVAGDSSLSRQFQLSIELSLSSINKTEPRFLHADLLDDSLRYKDSGCFIATAAFGADDCFEVMALRNYRDNRLSSSVIGRSFIRFYYCLSPALSRIIGASAILRSLTRFFLRKTILPLITHGH